MKTGKFIYWDGTKSEEFNPEKKLKGIAVVEDDNHAFLVLPKDIKEVDWWDGKRKCEEQFAQMPNLRQLDAIYKNKEVLNKAFIAAGGEALDDEAYYWSSTEYFNKHAWILRMSDGYRNYNFKYDSYSKYVRPVLAF
jgi:hypothetical protein|nr:MAG TPA: Protein of unknown function (DUF1566) [Caudoviricetes sp.]